ncbi:EF hand family protein [Trichomonas vaginalis G3]|uniref:EF hand family protein n=1 Tax=Trichomonas vaginalis (strain ATCC PRA-98 / G3) TaxID=412133 RepID=A2EWB9_TRIV3|nr:calcium ion binding [Trichomonas vaginalis G3]EAY03023.1 EF hand family protein [Trichomonas vaginalis G3]KAI5531446.1 calcium ion binding [Trichomonas vaginalis G3]|eukprot:XP_001315246.1 EF hand family protein [Trichomonas vaginalis G3]
MGASDSIPKPTKEEVNELTKTTHFNAEEINKLYAAFLKIAGTPKNQDGKIQPQEFFDSLAITNEEYGLKVFEAFDSTADGDLTFGEYVKGVSQLCERATQEEKAKFCFGLFDSNKSGTISKPEFLSFIEASLGEMEGSSPELARNIALQLFTEIDHSKDGNITYPEFFKAVQKNNNIVNCVNVHVEYIFK